LTLAKATVSDAGPRRLRFGLYASPAGICRQTEPQLEVHGSPGHVAACHHPLSLSQPPAVAEASAPSS